MYESMIQSVKLTDEEMEELRNVMIEVHPIIVKWCQKIYGKKGRYTKFRQQYFNGELESYKIGKKDRAQLERLQVVEIKLLQHNVPLCMKISRWYFQRSKQRMPGIDFSDFFQEAAMALVNSVYGYNGSTKFVTYLYWAINNQMKDFVRAEHQFSPPSADVIEMSNSVKNYIDMNYCSFEEAVQALGLSELEIKKVSSVNVVVYSEGSDEDFNGLKQVADHRKSDIDEFDSVVQKTLDTAGLNELERMVFDAYLTGDHGYQARVAEAKGVTRQAANFAFQRAKEKLRVKYQELQTVGV